MNNEPIHFVAYTRDPNTPESDMQEFVPHIVEWTENGIRKRREILAREPGEAITWMRSALEGRGVGMKGA